MNYSSRVIVELSKALDLTDTYNEGQRAAVRHSIDNMRFDMTMSDGFAHRELVNLLAAAGHVHKGGDLLDRIRTIAVNFQVVTSPDVRANVRDRILAQDIW